VGRLCEQKGQLLLVEAAARLAARGFEFELVLVGDGEMRPAIEKLIAAHGLEQRVRITGWASGDVVREHLLASRALVLPSFAEGLPVVLMEALAMGRPVVSTYVAGIPELVTPGKSGWLVPAGSISDLVVALEEVLQATPEHLSSLGAAGHARVRERHDARFCAETLMKLLPTRRAIPASR
jgi:glycosyltransferase involved in cell wall biosynthesis